MIQDAMRAWIDVSLEDGDPIPEPRPIEDYSGKFMVRVPKSLHRRLVKKADDEGVSLNAYCNFVLAEAVGGNRLLPQSKESTPVGTFILAEKTNKTYRSKE